VSSASADSTVKVWQTDSEPPCQQTIAIQRSGFALDVRIVDGPSDTCFLMASTDACKILVYASQKKTFHFDLVHQVHELVSHFYSKYSYVRNYA
jgi:hypothetical protein